MRRYAAFGQRASRTRPTTGTRCLRGERRVESHPSRRRVSTAVGTSSFSRRPQEGRGMAVDASGMWSRRQPQDRNTTHVRAAWPLALEHRLHPRRDRERDRPRQPVEVSVHHVGEQRRGLRPCIPRVHCRRGPARHDGRTTDRAGDAKERGRGAQGGHGPGVGLRWPLGRVLRISSAQLLHGDRGLVALLLRQVHGLDGPWIPGGCLDGRFVR